VRGFTALTFATYGVGHCSLKRRLWLQQQQQFAQDAGATDSLFLGTVDTDFVEKN
jgi:hypothetical protein